MEVKVLPSLTAFEIRMWWSLKDATCGMWVMAMTWLDKEISWIFSATAWAASPEMPVSISSKMTVETLLALMKMALKANMMRLASPPEMTLERLLSPSPILVSMRKSTSSRPFSFNKDGSSFSKERKLTANLASNRRSFMLRSNSFSIDLAIF